MQRWFITGTDTDVGKSVITACLAQAAHDMGRVIAAKPVASGVSPGEAGEDATLIASAGQHPAMVFETYEPPLSPHRAALIERRPLDVAGLNAWIDALEADIVLIEGVGGWRVPLSLRPSRLDVSDLAKRLASPVIIVAANRLGVLNHTLLTVEAVRQANLPIAGVVLNDVTESDELSRATNLDDLRELCDVPVIHVGTFNPNDAAERLRWGRHLWKCLKQS